MSKLVMAMLFASCVCLCVCQDPAQGWLSYAAGTNPAGGTGRITFMEAYWKVGQNPVESGAFFSPWFGIEASDNLNLIQPVNPWMGDSWAMYNEYYQWSPTNNINSDQMTVYPGDVLYGSVTFDNSTNSYHVFHSVTGQANGNVTFTIPVQKNGDGSYKHYTIAYIVFEKDADCAQYPPDNQVTFYNITIQYEGKTVTPSWTTSFVDDVCNNRAAVIDPRTIQITWDSNMSKKKLTDEESLVAKFINDAIKV